MVSESTEFYWAFSLLKLALADLDEAKAIVHANRGYAVTRRGQCDDAVCMVGPANWPSTIIVCFAAIAKLIDATIVGAGEERVGTC